jgi:hypothetical protein
METFEGREMKEGEGDVQGRRRQSTKPNCNARAEESVERKEEKKGGWNGRGKKKRKERWRMEREEGGEKRGERR